MKAYKIIAAAVSLIFMASAPSLGSDVENSYRWNHSHFEGGTDKDQLVDLVAHPNGDYTVLYNSESSVTFGDLTYTNAGRTDILIARYDSAGVNLWSQRIAGPGLDKGAEIVRDGNDQLYLTGIFMDKADFGEENELISSGGSDVFVAKLAAETGRFLWIEKIGGSQNDYSEALTIRNDNSLVLAGTFTGSMTHGNKELSSEGLTDVFVAGYDLHGTFEWNFATGGSGEIYPKALAVDEDGHLYLAGSFIGNSRIGSTSIEAEQYEDMFLTKLTGQGNISWTQTAHGSETGKIEAIATDSENGVYVTGSFGGEFDFGNETLNLTSYGSDDAFVAKYDSSGVSVWAYNAGSQSWDYGRDITVTASQHVVITGDYTGNLAWAGDNFTADGDEYDTDAFVLAYSVNGEGLWGKSVGGQDRNYGYTVTSGAENELLVGGGYFGSMTITGYDEVSTSNGKQDLFVGKLSTDQPVLLAQSSFTTHLDTVTLTISVEDAIDLRYYSFSAEFESSIIEFLDAEATGMLSENNVMIAGATSENSAGFSVGRTDTSVYGSGEICKLRFRIKQYPSDNTLIRFFGQEAYNTANKKIAAQAIPDVVVPLEPAYVVWPGDANADGTVDESDVLALGYFWGKEGASRQDASIGWKATPAQPWADTLATHGDTDGNGVIDHKDLRAIAMNFNNSHEGSDNISLYKYNTFSLESGSNNEPDDPSLASVTMPKVKANELIKVQVKSHKALTTRGLTARLRFENMPDDSYEVEDVKTGKWAKMWENQDQLLSFNVKNDENFAMALTAKGSRGLSPASVLNEEPIVTLYIRSKQPWAANARIELTGISTMADSDDSQFEANDIVLAIGDDRGEDITFKDPNESKPVRTKLLGNYPNPFNPTTSISFQLSGQEHVSIEIFDMLGQRVAVLADRSMDAGVHEVAFRGASLSSGTYLYRLRAGSYVETSKMTLLK